MNNKSAKKFRKIGRRVIERNLKIANELSFGARMKLIWDLLIGKKW